MSKFKENLGIEKESIWSECVVVEPAPRELFLQIKALAGKGISQEDHPRLQDWLKEHDEEYIGGGRPVIVARIGNKIVGFLVGRIDYDTDAKCSALYVVEEYRECGLESRLLYAFESLVLSNKKRKIHVIIYPEEKALIRFFRLHGYTFRKQFYDRNELPERSRGVFAIDFDETIARQPEIQRAAGAMLRHFWLDVMARKNRDLLRMQA